MFAPCAQVPVVRLLLALLAIPGVLSLTVPLCEVKEYCPGQEPGTFGAGSTVQAILADLRNTFCGCKRIGGSVNVFFPSMPTDNYNLTDEDFNFLYHLEEVGGGVTFINVPPIDRLTLPNLVLIRGNNLPSSSLVTNGFALSLVNSTVDRFVFPKLVEITVGSMQLYNSTWCGYYTVNWEDIFEAGSVHLLPNNDELNFTNELSMSCPSEDRQCSGCASGYCWASGDTTTCQTLTKIVCPAFCPERCSELDGSQFCCNTACAAGCSGITESHCVGPLQCKACRNFRIVHNAAGDSVACHNDTECVSACPVNYYADGMDCKLCHELCVGGCTGPGDFVGQGGCNTCDVVNFDHNDTQISCVAQCPVSTYRHQLEQAIGPVPASNGACHPCHDLCETCFGPLNTECFTCKFAAVENTTGDTTVSTCLDECPFNRYKAASKVCRPCHEQCDGCTGQGNKMCLQCKNVRVVVPQSQPPTTYECLASCPNISYWIDHDDNNTCIPCHYLCATCVGSSNSECTQCKAIQAVIIDLNRTVTVNGVDRTLYMCKATLGSTSGPENVHVGAVNQPWWVAVLVVVGCILVLILSQLVPLMIVCLMLCHMLRKRRKTFMNENSADSIAVMENPAYVAHMCTRPEHTPNHPGRDTPATRQAMLNTYM